MSVITDTHGSTIFVASSLPPRPTSSTAKSTPTLAKYSNIMAVSISKKLGCHGSSPRSTRPAAAASTRSNIMANSASLMGSPLICMRSFTRNKCGDVYSPTRYPAACAILASVAAVEPFPFVPAINTLCSRRCGLPNAWASLRMWSKSNLRCESSSWPKANNLDTADSYVTGTALGRLWRHEVEGPRDKGLQIFALDHGVKHAVLQKKLAGLEARRQLLANGLLNNARPGKPNQRTRLRDIQVAQHGVRSRNASGGGVGQDGNVRHLRGIKTRQRGRDFCHLHQADHAFHHAR